MDMINIAFCNVMLRGDRDGNPHTFPIPTYGITKQLDWDSLVVNKIFDVAAKFGLPYFMNYIGSGMDPSSNRAMCCRLQMDLNEIIEKTKGGLWNTGVNTGSLSVVTINLPQLGYIAHTMSRSSSGAQTINSNAFADMHSIFFSRLNTLLDAARRHNVWKRERINVGFELGLMPFTRSYLKNFEKFFSTIGVVGMNECCLNMFGKPVYECENFVESVLSHIHGYVQDLTKEYGYPWNFEETPAEGCSHSLAIKDKLVYPDIITQGKGDGVFYTNSSHIYVGDELSLGESLNIQQKFKSYYNGGTLFHIFCGESSPNRDGLKDLIRNICTNTTIPYLALTRAYAVCPGCGVISDLSGICPKCGAETTVWDRVTGYYRPVDKYNPGKQAEFIARERFEVG
jgi:ribonucleoside-triphosphate reductase